ncbi:MAG: small conductance mechanosensitive channel [Myxococcota bacterium]|jgi:small conductance mechanosensitive channel
MSEILAQIFSTSKTLQVIVALLPSILAALLAAGMFWLVWQVVHRLLNAALQRIDMEPMAAAFIRGVVRLSFSVIATLTVLDQIGIDTTSIIASLGVVGLTIGFAAQDTISNIISGIFIFWDRPFVLNDLVDIDGVYGRVDKITLRSTRLVTPDGRMIAIPNAAVINSKVASYTNFPTLRLDIPITVGVNEDLTRIRGLLLGLISPPDFLPEPAPVVLVTALNDYNVAIELRAWIGDEKSHIARRAELREQAFEILRSAGVDMPYETFQIVRSVEIASTGK